MLKKLGVSDLVSVELDKTPNGVALAAALRKYVAKTHVVPQIFIHKQHIGGLRAYVASCDRAESWRSLTTNAATRRRRRRRRPHRLKERRRATGRGSALLLRTASGDFTADDDETLAPPFMTKPGGRGPEPAAPDGARRRGVAASFGLGEYGGGVEEHGVGGLAVLQISEDELREELGVDKLGKRKLPSRRSAGSRGRWPGAKTSTEGRRAVFFRRQ